jgi:hypothetical protein
MTCELWSPNRVYSTPDPMQPPAFYPVMDGIFIELQRDQLPSRHHTVLPFRKSPNPSLRC